MLRTSGPPLPSDDPSPLRSKHGFERRDLAIANGIAKLPPRSLQPLASELPQVAIRNICTLSTQPGGKSSLATAATGLLSYSGCVYQPPRASVRLAEKPRASARRLISQTKQQLPCLTTAIAAQPTAADQSGIITLANRKIAFSMMDQLAPWALGPSMTAG
jgi:hypothetical protein